MGLWSCVLIKAYGEVYILQLSQVSTVGEEMFTILASARVVKSDCLVNRLIYNWK